MASLKAQVYQVEYLDERGNRQKEDIYIADKKIRKKDDNKSVRKIKSILGFSDYGEEISEEMIETELGRFGKRDDPTKNIRKLINVKWLREGQINKY